MKFVMIPTWPLLTTPWVDRGDKARFMALPMPGKRVTDLAEREIVSTIYPKIMTTEQLCKWWHRVRRWKVVANHPLWPPNQECQLSLNESFTTDEEIVDDMPYGWNNVGSGIASDWFAAGAWSGSFEWTDTLEQVHGVDFTLRILAKPIAPHIDASYYLTGDFTEILPYLRLTAGGVGIDGNAWSADSAAMYETPEIDRPEQQGSTTCTVDGLAITMTSYFATGSGFESDPMTLVLTPSLFWEYRDADGLNPKYDSLTGAIL